MPNRAERRKEAREGKALARKLSYLSKTEEKRLWFNEGFYACRKACYAAFAIALKDPKVGLSTDDIVDTLRQMDDALTFYIGEDELIQTAFEKTGLILDFDGVFPEERIQKKEA